MTDRALALAQYMVEGPQLSGDEFTRDIMAKFGDLTRDDFVRGVAIGSELLEAYVAERQIEAKARCG